MNPSVLLAVQDLKAHLRDLHEMTLRRCRQADWHAADIHLRISDLVQKSRRAADGFSDPYLSHLVRLAAHAAVRADHVTLAATMGRIWSRLDATAA